MGRIGGGLSALSTSTPTSPADAVDGRSSAEFMPLFTPGAPSLRTPAKTPRFDRISAPPGGHGPIAPAMTPGKAFRLGRGLATPAKALYTPAGLRAAAAAGDLEAADTIHSISLHAGSADQAVVAMGSAGTMHAGAPSLDEVLCLKSLAAHVQV